MKKFILFLFLFGFLLNFVWEITQMGFGFFDFGFFNSVNRGDYSRISFFILVHLGATIADVLMIFGAYSIISLLMKGWYWPRKFNIGWLLLLSFLPVWAWVNEYVSVYKLHLWVYGQKMPLVFGAGLLPLLQMAILPSTTLLLARSASSLNKT